MTHDQRTTRKAILVTGGAGYIGSQLLRDLVDDPRFRDYTIRVYDNLQRQHLCGLLDLPSEGRFEFIEGDILDQLNLERAMEDVETVIHLAAIVRTPLSFDRPEWMEQINHWGTATLIECALNAGVERLVFASSASVYGPGGPFTEEDRPRPIGPYSVSKHKAEHEVLQATERGLDATVVRLGTVFGNAPAMRFDAMANRFAYLAGTGQPIVIHGSGGQTRPLIAVQDASNALLTSAAGDADMSEGILNAVAYNPSVRDVAHAIEDLVPNVTVRHTDQDHLTEMSFEVRSTKHPPSGEGWSVSLEEGLHDVLSRWQSFRTWPPMGTSIEA